jgi:hypothetical protein
MLHYTYTTSLAYNDVPRRGSDPVPGSYYPETGLEELKKSTKISPHYSRSKDSNLNPELSEYDLTTGR